MPQPADAPWLRNAEWASGRLSDRAPRDIVGYAATALAVGAFAATFIIEGVLQRDLRFAAVGIGMLVLCIALIVGGVRAVQRRRFRATLVLDTLPGTIGGSFRGKIEIGGDAHVLRRARTMKATLSSRLIREESRPLLGRHSGASLWSKTLDIAPASVRYAAGVATLPVEFAIPTDVHPSNQLHLNGRTRWYLDVDADIPNTRYWAQFEVPVFGNAPAEGLLPPQLTLAMPSAAIEPSAEPIVAPSAPQIRTEETPAALRLFFAPFQARKFAFMLLGFTTIFGLSAFMARHSAFWFLLMAASTLLLACLTFDLFLASSSVVVRENSVFVERRLILAVRKTIPRAAIIDVRLHLAAGTGSSDDNWYRIDLITRDRTLPTVLGKYIRSRAEADWLIERIRQRLRLSS